MDASDQLGRLIDLCEELGIAIRKAPAGSELGASDHPGGAVVRLKGSEILFLDTTASLGDQIAATATALRGRSEIEDRFLPPEIRELIDSGGGR